MLELYIQYSGYSGTYESLDLYPGEEIELVYQVNDVFEFGTIKGSYTKEFIIPASKKNSNIFSHIYNVNTYGTDIYDVTKKVRCIIKKNSVELLRGFLQVVGHNKKIDGGKEIINFKIQVYGRNINLFEDIGDRKISDYVSLSGYNHTLTNTTIFASIPAFPNTSKYVYAMIDRGNDIYSERLPGHNNYFWHNQNGIRVRSSDDGIGCTDLTPCLQAKTIIDTIFSAHGYTYSSPLFSSTTFTNVVIPATDDSIYSGTGLYCSAVTIGGVYSHALQNALVPIDSGGTDYYYTYKRLGEQPPSGTINVGTWTYFNFDGWDGTYTNAILIRKTDNYYPKITITISSKTTSSKVEFNIYKINPQNVDFQYENYNQIIGSDVYKRLVADFIGTASMVGQEIAKTDFTADGTYTLTLSDPLEFSEGDYIVFTFSDDSIAEGFNYDLYIEWRGEKTKYMSHIDIPKIAGDMKARDFLSSISKMYNLVWDNQYGKYYYIAPRDTYYENGQTSVNVRVDKNTAEYTFIGDKIAREYNFKYNSNDDYYSKRFFGVNSVEYGKKIVKTNNEFLTNTIDITPSFAASPILPNYKYIDNGIHYWPVTRLYVEPDGRYEYEFDGKPRILYFKLLKSPDATKRFNYFGTLYPTTTGGLAFPYAGHLSDPFFTGSTSLNFADDSLMFKPSANTISQNTLYNMYWSATTSMLTDKQTQFVECEVLDEFYNINSFNFNNKIWFDDAYWVVNSITYNTNGRARLEMYKFNKIQI